MLSEPRDEGGEGVISSVMVRQCRVKYGSLCGMSVTISRGHDVDTTSNGVGIHGRLW